MADIRNRSHQPFDKSSDDSLFNTGKPLIDSPATSQIDDSEWTRDRLKELEKIVVSPHFKPVTRQDRIAARMSSFLDAVIYLTWQNRLYHQATMMETLGVVPGWVAFAYHHVRSLFMTKTSDWETASLQTALLERWHLYALCSQLSTSILSGILVWTLSFLMTGMWFILYTPMFLLFPQMAHRFNGYLEEMAVDRYSCIIDAIDSGQLHNPPAPPLAIKHWKLPADATVRDVMLVIRAEEADFREVHHQISTHYCDRPDKLDLDMTNAQTPANLHLPEKAAARIRPSSDAPAGDLFPSKESDPTSQVRSGSMQFHDKVNTLDKDVLSSAGTASAAVC